MSEQPFGEPADLAPATPAAHWRHRLYDVIFLSDTPAGKAFDVVLIAAIMLSVIVVMVESVAKYQQAYGPLLRGAEWAFTILFTVEYLLRLGTVRRPGVYARSFFGVIDLLAVLPTYLSLVVPGAQYFLVIRMLRVLRIFRVLKLAHYLDEADLLIRALRASRRKIEVFSFAVITLVVILGALMYFVEGEEHGFDSIPRSVYWAIVTLTTVGYGDISPQTNLGQGLAALIMIMGYGIIAVPTGIVTAEIARAGEGTRPSQTPAGAPPLLICEACGRAGHDADAAYCKRCGNALTAH